MEINLQVGENLTIKTPAGTVVLTWVLESEDLIVGIGYNQLTHEIEQMPNAPIPSEIITHTFLISEKA